MKTHRLAREIPTTFASTEDPKLKKARILEMMPQGSEVLIIHGTIYVGFLSAGNVEYDNMAQVSHHDSC